MGHGDTSLHPWLVKWECAAIRGYLAEEMCFPAPNLPRGSTGLITHSISVLRLLADDRWRVTQFLQTDEGESKDRQINTELHYAYCARIFLRLGETINLVCYQTKPKHSVACILSEWMSDQLNLLVQVTLLPLLTADCHTYQDTSKSWNPHIYEYGLWLLNRTAEYTSLCFS